MIGTIALPTPLQSRRKPTARFSPLPWQVRAWRDKSLVVLLTGSAGGGKSSLAAEKVHGYCLRYPGAVAICLRKAREYASKSVVYAIRRAAGDDPSVRYHAAEQTFHYDNGSRIFIAGMRDEGQRQALRSINGDGSADIIWAEEANALSEDDHNELLARLRGRAGGWRQLIYSTNPDAPTHWIKRRLIDGGEASVHYSSARDNPHNPGEYLGVLASLTGVLGRRLAAGQWVQAEGAVYEEWNDGVHWIEPFAIPADWRRFRVVDFGYVNPFVCQWWAVDPDGTMYLYREIYRTQRTVRRHGLQIKALSEGEVIEATIADHDAEDRATLEEVGIPTIAAKKEIVNGLNAVRERLRPGRLGKPRLFILRNSLVEMDEALETAKLPTHTAAEVPGYVYPRSGDGRAVKETPVKENDHGLDALRYAVMYLDSEKVVQFAANYLGATKAPHYRR